MTATVTSGGSKTWSIALALRSLAASASGSGSAAVSEVSSLSSSLAVDASVGVLRISYGGTASVPVPHNSTSAQIAAAINSVTNAASVSVTGQGTTAVPWVITRVPTEMTLGTVGSTGASLTSGGGDHSTYTLSYTTAGDIELSFNGTTQTVEVSDGAALKSSIETLTGMSATVTGVAGSWSISLELKSISASAAGLHAIATTTVAGDTQSVVLDANAGVHPG